MNMKDKWQKQRAFYNRQEKLNFVITKSCRDQTPVQLLNGHIPQAQHFEENGNTFCLLFPTHHPTPQSAAACVVSLFSALEPGKQNLPASKPKAGGAAVISS